MVPADLPAQFFSFPFGVCSVASTLAAIAFYLPTTILVRHHSVSVSSQDQSPFARETHELRFGLTPQAETKGKELSTSLSDRARVGAEGERDRVMHRSVLLLFALLISASPASAQFSTAPMPSWYDYGTMRQQTINGINRHGRIARRGTSPTLQPNRSPPRQTSSGTTTFRPRGTWILPMQLAAQHSSRQLEVVAFYTRLLEAHREMVVRKGVPPHDVARAAAYAVSSLYYVHHEGAQPSDAELDALRRQVAEVFLRSQIFQGMNDRERQLAYEQFVIQGMGISALFESARSSGNRRQLREIRAIARQDLGQITGVPASQLRLTESGITD